MPWQDNSGNRGGGRGPWGQPPRGGNGGSNNGGGRSGGEPPDLEDLLQASRQRLKRAFPRGGRGNGAGGRGGGGFEINRSTGGLIAAALAVLYVFSCAYQVAPNELAVVTTFGKYTDVTGPGLRWKITPIQSVIKQPALTVLDMSIPARDRRTGGLSQGLMLTGDKNIVDVAFTVQWKIKSDTVPEAGEKLPGVAQFIFNIDEPEELVRTVGEASMREVVGSNTLDFLQTGGRLEVQQQTQDLMQEALDSYNAGIQIESVLLTGTEPPTNEVNEAFRDVQAAEQNQATVIQQARQYTNRVVPEARGEAQRILEDAGAYASRVTAEARGQAQRFDNIYEEYRKAPEVTRQRMYLETVERVLSDMDKIIIEEGAGSGVVPYLPLNEVRRQQGDN